MEYFLILVFLSKAFYDIFYARIFQKFYTTLNQLLRDITRILSCFASLHLKRVKTNPIYVFDWNMPLRTANENRYKDDRTRMLHVGGIEQLWCSMLQRIVRLAAED